MKISKLIIVLGALILSSVSLSANASDTINLGGYTLNATYALNSLNGTAGGISGLEASAVTYARDRNSLFYVGNEDTGVVEISLTGQYIGNNLFNWAGTGSSKRDSESLTYIGGGVLVLAEERLQDAYQFNYVAGGTVTLANNFVSTSNIAVGNNGLEGISYDPRDGSFVTIKQQSPQDVRAGTLTFAAASGAPPLTTGDGSTPPGGGISTMATLFNPSLMGLTTLSDVQTLSPVDALAGTAAADNLLMLSLGSRKLIEVTRTGVVKSSFDLSTILPNNAIEGVTVDQFGTIYIVAEQIQDGVIPMNPKSQLIVLTAAVPEPESYAMLLAGLGLIRFVARRKSKQN